MIVLDASAAVDYLLGVAGRVEWLADRLGSDESHVPQLFEYEVVSALRAATLRRDVTPRRAAIALGGLADLPATRYPPYALLPRIWQLRSVLTVYDASYVALAEALGAPLVTADARLARSRGHRAAIELVPA